MCTIHPHPLIQVYDDCFTLTPFEFLGQAMRTEWRDLRNCNLVHLSDKVCKRPWNFERIPNSAIEGQDKALIFTSTKVACLAACLNEVSLSFSRLASKCVIDPSLRKWLRIVWKKDLLLFGENLDHLGLTRFFQPTLFQENFVCRSAEYNYVTLQCKLSDVDRRTVRNDFPQFDSSQFALTRQDGVDYFENLCLQSE